MPHRPIAILGAGAWGTALALTATRAGRTVLLWARDPEQAREINRARLNRRYLPNVPLPPAIEATSELADVGRAGLLIAAVPAQALRQNAQEIAGILPADVPVIIAAKGIEQTTGKFMSEIVREILPKNPPALLSGPSFAVDVGRGLPTAVTLAAGDVRLAQTIARSLASPTFRLYHSDDVRGVEIGGAAKNVLAIASGIATGRGLGASASAALITRGFAELGRFGRAYGARTETLMGLSGLGDLILTCNSAQSRNFSFGLKLGQGLSLVEALDGKLVEGAYTASALVRMARAKHIDMPIALSVVAVLEGQLTIEAAIDALLARPSKAEI